MDMKRAANMCVFKDFNGDTWHFAETTDAQGVHYKLSDVHGTIITEVTGMNMSFQSWCQDLIKQAMDSSV